MRGQIGFPSGSKLVFPREAICVRYACVAPARIRPTSAQEHLHTVRYLALMTEGKHTVELIKKGAKARPLSACWRVMTTWRFSIYELHCIDNPKRLVMLCDRAGQQVRRLPLTVCVVVRWLPFRTGSRSDSPRI